MMKYMMLILICCTGLSSVAQTVVKPGNLQVAMNRTTILIFPSAILSIDRGSEWIVVQKSTGNILRVKADTVFKDTTNLSVITSDGKLYSFLVSYAASPEILNLDFGSGPSIVQDTALAALAKMAMQLKNRLHGLSFSQGNVCLSVTGVYTNSEVVICRLRIENNSSLSFETARIRCTVSGSGSGKRRPVQEMEVQPLLVQSTVAVVRANQSGIVALVVPKAALGPGQVLKIDVSEKGGERHLTLIIPNKYILKSTLLK